MPLIIFNSFLERLNAGEIDFGDDTIKVMLSTESYVPDQDTHEFRDDVTNEVAGTGYTAGRDNTRPTESCAPDQDTHEFRDDVTNEVAGTGYTAGGATVEPTAVRDNVLNRLTVTLPGAAWENSTLANVRVATYYKSRGGASSADELIAANVFPGNISTAAGALTLAPSTITFAIQ